MTDSATRSLSDQHLAPIEPEPREHYDSPFCDCLPRHEANRLLLAAKGLLQVIDQAPIRKAALACGAEIYEKGAELIDAITAAEKAFKGNYP
jgi:hypothetical protein